MSISRLMQMAAAGQVGGDYQISRSLRFNSADSTYLSRTPASAGDRETWTWSGWVKRSALGATQVLFGAESGGTRDELRFDSGDTLNLFWADAASYQLISTQVFRDVGAWGHLVVAIDTSQATSTNRVKIYWNGIQITAFGTSNYPIVNFVSHINNNVAHNIGRIAGSSSGYFNGYLTEINFIDGGTPSTAVDADGSITGTPGATYLLDFGEFSATTGVWSPIRYAGSYGTNGFYLKFSNNSDVTAATLGADYSGNGNNWTPSGSPGFSVTAGAGNDSLVDTPTQYGDDTGAGGEVRGNYATLNPLSAGASATLTNGNLNASLAASTATAVSTIAFDAGTTTGFYAECLVTTSTNGGPLIGIRKVGTYTTSYIGSQSTDYAMYSVDGDKYSNSSGTGYGSATTDGNVIGIAVKNGKIYFRNQNGWFNSADFSAETGFAFSGITGDYVLGASNTNSSTVVVTWNFGQRPFAYTAPSGFKALVTTNLPEPTVVQGDDYFNTVLYTGNGSTQSITGVGFQPDWVWLKVRSTADNHKLTDAVRGATKTLFSNNTDNEFTEGNALTSFDSDGFSLGSDSGNNGSGRTFVAWNWKANGAGVSNTDGTIPGTVTVSANTIAGISIVTYTGSGSAATVGHGLGAAPKMIIVKSRDEGTTDYTAVWDVYHSALGPTKAIYLNETDAAVTQSNIWNDTAPTSSVFSIGTAGAVNFSTDDYVAYCFAEVEGFSKFGSYTGNGSADGPFVYTGFRPAFVMIKISSTTGDWLLYDNKRNSFNVVNAILYPNLSDAEAVSGGGATLDFVSNGFKLRGSGSGFNDSGATFVYACFASNPFKTSLAR